MGRYLIFDSQCTGRFIGPQTSDIFDCVASTAEKDEWDGCLANELDNMGVALHREVETAEFISSQRVCSALKDDYGRSKDVEDSVEDL
jgi:hypothetical protein